jgi:tetraacyldisaccharide 4'-kinase
VLAFAGIGRPGKLFATLESLGCTLVGRHGFPDHHPYTPDDIMRLVEAASAAGAVPVTTEKDLVRFPPEARPMVTALRVSLEWRDEAALDSLLRPLLGAPAPASERHDAAPYTSKPGPAPASERHDTAPCTGKPGHG